MNLTQKTIEELDPYFHPAQHDEHMRDYLIHLWNEMEEERRNRENWFYYEYKEDFNNYVKNGAPF